MSEKKSFRRFNLPNIEATVLEDLEQPFLGGVIAYTVV
jgi:hypothetical protein